MNNLQSWFKNFLQDLVKEKFFWLILLFLTVVYTVSLYQIYHVFVQLVLVDRKLERKKFSLINQKELDKAISNLGKKNGSQKEKASEVKTATDSAGIKVIQPQKATESGIINVKEIAIEVLNGSGVPGVATEIGQRFAALGYDVVNIDNAPRQDYQSTLIRYKKAFKFHISRLKELMKDKYESFELITLSDDFPVDISVILGR